ncbi:DUF1552 domain-containing protein [Candidatus Laterigemmans baculatus]|uniref:DUF1552 domain-containing protein n=1 Tax=Candidatus Laterigemmans baculatus TaxID=2770505 RepID=UPI0013DBFB3D|nr:DUF1552 domain-containing protein [Candidatus Laterigemmans baculatus]
MTMPMLSRRTMLRGLGLTVGLPLLEAMGPAARAMAAPLASGGSAAGGASPVRMAAVFFPNGVIVPDWMPSGEGSDWKLGKSLQSLEPMQSKLNLISGLALDNGRAKKDGAGDHARAGATFLTAARPIKTASNIQVGVSVDQVAAQQLAGKTKLASIELGLQGSRNAGSCDSGYSCAYSSNISWRSADQPMAKEMIPRMAFERLFGNGDQKGRAERDFYRKSILDLVAADAQQLMGQLNKTDQRKMDEYFTSVRELEKRIERTEQEDAAARPDMELPEGRPEEFVEHARLMFDLIVLGFQTDSTRIATLMLDNAGGNRAYKAIGVNDGHHQLSHHQNKEEPVAKLQKIDQYLAENFAYFLEKMDSVKEADGRSLLDNSIVLYGSGLGDGNRHTHHDLPIILAGSGGGQLQTGRHLKLKDETPMANLFLSMLDLLGTPAESIGDSTGRLPGLV